MQRFWLVVALIVLVVPGVAPAAASAAAAQPASFEVDSGVRVSVDSGGRFEIGTATPGWTFGGTVGRALTNIRVSAGEDGVGRFEQVEFDYQVAGERTSGIRAYEAAPVVLFSTMLRTPATNSDPFPVLDTYPALPHKLSFRSTSFSPYQMNTLNDAADSPWLFFDQQADGFILSPADNFLVARMTDPPGGNLVSGIASSIPSLPAGFTHRTMLTVSPGVNRLFDTWGSAMIGLHRKVTPANDADLTLEKLGYWTDNGAVYYYAYDLSLGYAETLVAIKQEFEQKGLPLGYLQLDSWFYPKGPTQRWQDGQFGIYRYEAHPELFRDNLAGFRQQLGLPLVTHARWLDPSSPYRSEYSVSGNVATDPRYWDSVMAYLRDGGVVTYEQDWLGAWAQPEYTTLEAPQQYLDNMAASAAAKGLTMQYCMAMPRHFLQGLKYQNLTTIRVADDRFRPQIWSDFLYGSRFASAVGTWPWADVFMSSERNNLLLATLSGGTVGVGDRLGEVNVENLRQVIRGDGVLVKPDAPIVPTDETYVDEARGGQLPMVAFTHTAHPSHPGLRALYVFAYRRSSSAPQTATFNPSRLGLTGDAYVYDVFADAGRVLLAGETYTASVDDGSYFVVAPIGPSGMAFLGDAGQFASLGRKRISEVTDAGQVRARVEMVSGDRGVRLHAHTRIEPTVSVEGGTVEGLVFDAGLQRVSFTVVPDATPSQVMVTLAPRVAAE